MELRKIKQFVKNNGDKFVFVEDGEPLLVVMSFQEYEKIANGSKITPQYQRGHGSFDVVAASVESERMRVQQEEMGAWNSQAEAGNLQKSLENIRLEDLPL